jgi:hypothetical protein
VIIRKSSLIESSNSWWSYFKFLHEFCIQSAAVADAMVQPFDQIQEDAANDHHASQKSMLYTLGSNFSLNNGTLSTCESDFLTHFMIFLWSLYIF